MNQFSFGVLLLAAILAVFGEASIELPRNLLGAQIDLLPPLMVYTSLTRGPLEISLLALIGGLCFDSLSANPLGATMLPLFLAGFITYQCRGLLLRTNTHAQFVLGASASAGVPIATVLIISALGDRPLIAFGSLWQLVVMAVGGGVLTPPCFWLFDWINSILNYQAVNQSSFRADREIKRGR